MQISFKKSPFLKKSTKFDTMHKFKIGTSCYIPDKRENKKYRKGRNITMPETFTIFTVNSQRNHNASLMMLSFSPAHFFFLKDTTYEVL